MELVDKFEDDPKIYHRYGLYNGEKIENYYWTKMIKHPDKTPKQVRDDLHIYYNDQGKYGPIYTMNRKGFTVTEYQKSKNQQHISFYYKLVFLLYFLQLAQFL